jgi:hypothetical protein
MQGRVREPARALLAGDLVSLGAFSATLSLGPPTHIARRVAASEASSANGTDRSAEEVVPLSSAVPGIRNANRPVDAPLARPRPESFRSGACAGIAVDCIASFVKVAANCPPRRPRGSAPISAISSGDEAAREEKKAFTIPASRDPRRNGFRLCPWMTSRIGSTTSAARLPAPYQGADPWLCVPASRLVCPCRVIVRARKDTYEVAIGQIAGGLFQRLFKPFPLTAAGVGT